MKIYLIFFGIIFIGAESAFVLQQIDAVYGQIEAVDFDAEGNIYVASYFRSHEAQNLRTSPYSVQADDGYTHRLFKLTPARELIWAIDLPPPIEVLAHMFVTSYGDVYFSFWNWNDTASEEYQLFGILKSGSGEVEIVEQLETFPSDFQYLDDNDNLIYARKSGIHILKPNTTVPTPIKNLEGYTAAVRPRYGVTDSAGNVYIGVFGDFEYYVALLTKESLHQNVPEARLFLAVDEGRGQRLNDLVIDKNDDLWVVVGRDYETGYVKKLINDTIKTIKIHNNHPDMEVTAANDRIYVVDSNMLYVVSPSIYYITLDNEVVEIPELSELTAQQFFLSTTVADKDGNAYFKTFNLFTPDLGPLIVIKANGTQPISIKFDDPDEILDDMSIDGHGNVWIMTNLLNIYSIRKGEAIAEPIESFGGICNNVPVVTNPVTKEVFLSCTGMYLIVDKN